jgi:hypothetical protein
MVVVEPNMKYKQNQMNRGVFQMNKMTIQKEGGGLIYEHSICTIGPQANIRKNVEL